MSTAELTGLRVLQEGTASQGCIETGIGEETTAQHDSWLQASALSDVHKTSPSVPTTSNAIMPLVYYKFTFYVNIIITGRALR